MAIEPVTREERFLAAAGGRSVTPPEPITRKEQLLQGIIDAVKSGGATPDVIEGAVNDYLNANPVQPGATDEQAAQIEQNKSDIADLQTEVDELKESGGNGSGENLNPVEKTEDMTQPVGADANGKLWTAPGSGTGGGIADGGVTTAKLADAAVTPEKTSFFEAIVEASDNMLMFDGVYAKMCDSTLYSIGCRYGQQAVAVNLRANVNYMMVLVASGASASYDFTKFNGKNPSTDYPETRMWEADIEESGNLTGTYTEVVPTITKRYTNTKHWWTGEFDTYGAKIMGNFPLSIDGDNSTYWLANFHFTVDTDFRGLIAFHSALKPDADGLYTRIYEVTDEFEYNPFFHGLPAPMGEGVGRRWRIKDDYVRENVEKVIADMPSVNNPLKGLRWYAAGDSLTQYSGGLSEVANPDDNGFITQIMRKTGVTGTNGGKAGQKWSSGTDGELENGSAVDRVNTIINGPEMYDIVTFAYGTNSDVDGEGNVEDEPAYDGTMCAAIKWCIEHLVEWNPQVQIGIILPPQRADMGASGNLLMKTRGALIREVAELYGVPCCDMWRESGINTMHYTNPATGNQRYYYLSDMLHLSGMGTEKYAACLRAFLERIAPVYPNNGVYFAYTITADLTNVAINNNATRSPAGNAYKATLTATTGAIASVTVTMGGVDITETAYADGVITIEEITGDIVITASAE